MLNKFSKITITTLSSIMLSACAGGSFSDIFSNYNQQMQGVKIAQQQGNYQQAISAIPKRDEGDNNYNLSLLEKARLEQLAKNYEQSQSDFEYVYREVQQADQAAKIQLSRGLKKVNAVVTNDNALTYDIPYYEQSMLNSYQAFNYLSQRDLSGALVEVRRANLVQNRALTENQTAIAESQQELAKQNVDEDSFNKAYPSMSDVIGKVKNGFQNAYTFYLSGVLYEAGGQPNDAYIDYKKALEIYPNNITLQRDVWRLATELGMVDDIQRFSQRFSSQITTHDKGKTETAETAQLVILLENGIINSKQEAHINLPIWTRHNDARFYNVALPFYENRLRHYPGISFNHAGNRYQSQEIVRLQSLAAKNLQDNMPGIVARQIVRVVAKEELRQQMSKKGGDLGNIFANLYNIASERADTRSWSTLPDSIHILRVNIEPGEHTIDVRVNGRVQTLTFTANATRQTLLQVTAINQHINYQSYNL